LNKYGAVKTKIDGYTFDSKKEAKRYRELCLLERAGEISDILVHPKYVLQEAFIDIDNNKIRGITYEADFAYIENKSIVVEDVKGMITAMAKLKIKIFKRLYPTYKFRIVK